MNQQNFKLSDFGIDTKLNHDFKHFNVSGQAKLVRNVSQTGSGFGQNDFKIQARQVQMSPSRLGTSPNGPNQSQTGSGHLRTSPNAPNLLQTGINGQPRTKNPNQLQNVGTGMVVHTSPSHLSGTSSMLQRSSSLSTVPSPSYWKQYGGQESGVNTYYEFRTGSRRFDPVRGGSK